MQNTENTPFAKTLKKQKFFNAFGDPRRSKTASEDARRLPRGYLGLLRAILSHLGGMLSPRASKITPSACDRALGSPSWVLSGSIWGPILGPDRPKRGQDGPKRTIKRCKIPKTRICKHLEKIYSFLRFLGVQGRPRQVLKTQEGSQEAILGYSGPS